jgi:hypothetical protein
MRQEHEADPRRVEFREGALEVAMDAVEGRVIPGCRLLGITGGQYSLLDLIRAILSEVGPAAITLSTWTAGIKDMEHAAFLLDRGFIRSLRIISDRSFPTRKPEYVAKICELFGKDAVTLANTHAKFALLETESAKLVLRTSMNLSGNPRIEYWELDDDPRMFAWFARFASTLIEETRAGFDVAHKEISEAMRLALEALDRTMTTAEYAKHRGVTIRAVNAAIADGRCPRNDDGIPVVAADKAWPRKSRRDPVVVPRDGAVQDDDGVTLHEAKLRFELARAKKLEREEAAAAGDTISAREARGVVQEICTVMRDAVEAFPDRLTTEIASSQGTEDRPAVRAVLEREGRALLEAMSEALGSLADTAIS